jgi:formylglycine-generating enzyme required for sulfatase activity
LEPEKNNKLSLKTISEFVTHTGVVLGGIIVVLTSILWLFGVSPEQIPSEFQTFMQSEAVDIFWSTYGVVLTWGALAAFLLVLAVVMRYARKLERRSTETADEDFRPLTALDKYLDHLTSNSSFLPFGDHSTLETATSNQETRITLDEVWTDLHVSVEPSELGTDVKNKAEEYVFEELVYGETRADDEDKPLRLIVLGEPGSGKSSSLARLANKYCDALKQGGNECSLLPISIRIDQVNLKLAKPMEAICRALDLDAEEQDSIHGDFTKAAISGAAIFLIDGLDELAENDKGKAASFLEKIASEYPLSKVIASCRTDDFHDSTDYSALRKFSICTLQPYSVDDLLGYISKWYLAFGKRQNYSPARRERAVAQLGHAIQADDALLGLARTPLLTALICLVHAIRSELPRTRSLLYFEGIQLLLTGAWREDTGDDEEHASTEEERPSIREAMGVVSHIAFETHVLSERDGSSGRYGITEAEIGAIIDARVGRQSTHSDEDELALRVRSANLMRQILNSNSLLVEAGPKTYKFSHRAFQEFLVGQYFASGSKTNDVVERASSLHWAEPFRLLANYSSVRGGNLFYVLHLCSKIFRQRSDVLSRCLVGEMLCEIGETVLRSEDYGFVLDGSLESNEEDHAGVTSGLWSLARDSVYRFAMSDSLADNHELRLRLFKNLSELGDPRLVNGDGSVLPISELMVSLERRIVSIGHNPESEYLRTRLNSANALKSYPKRNVLVDSFQMSRYLVTNIDFQRFMSAGGYREERFWSSEAARNWLRGDKSFQNKLFDGWLETAERDYKREISDETMSVDSLRETASQVLAARQKPYYWDNPRFRISTAPVVGVNLWEAAAYCNWLTEELRAANQIGSNDVISVPSEFEWERAARDCNETAEYPWGDEWDVGRGHVNHGALDLNSPAPVGMFPRGACPNGPMDLCGNVWEWTTSSASNWDGPIIRDACFNSIFDDIVVRGSSWYNSHELARSGIRQCDRLYNIYFDLGFRWVLMNNDEREHEKFI